MATKSHQKHKERLKKKHAKNIKTFLKKKNGKEEKYLQKNIKILKKKKKNLSTRKNTFYL